MGRDRGFEPDQDFFIDLGGAEDQAGTDEEQGDGGDAACLTSPRRPSRSSRGKAAAKPPPRAAEAPAQPRRSGREGAAAPAAEEPAPRQRGQQAREPRATSAAKLAPASRRASGRRQSPAAEEEEQAAPPPAAVPAGGRRAQDRKRKDPEPDPTEEQQPPAAQRKRTRGAAASPSPAPQQEAAAGRDRRRGSAREASAPAPEQLPPREVRGRQQRSPSAAVAAAAAATLEIAAPSPAAERPQEAQPAAGRSASPAPAAAIASQYAAMEPAQAARTWLLARLADPRGPEAATAGLRPSLAATHDALVENLTNTIELGHNNSVLLLGPRGAGKSLAVERALGTLCGRWNTNPADPLVAVVRLAGWAHADDRVAFREIARQLCEGFRYSFARGASVGDNIGFLRTMLAGLARAHKAAVFVLDEFDLFARRAGRQAVLYNLLDAVASSGMSAAVVGVSVRQDAVDLLEKRVKSRFSHRKLDLAPPRRATAGSGGSAAAGGAAAAAGGEGGAAEEPEDGALDVLKAMLTLPPEFPHAAHAARHNAAVATALAPPAVAAALQRYIDALPSLSHLAMLADAALAAAAGSGGLGLVTQAALVDAMQALGRHHAAPAATIAGLSVLELIVLVAMHRVTARTQEAVNFEMVHSELGGYVSRSDHVDNYTRAAAAKAFDRLVGLGLAAYVDARAEAWAGARQYAGVHLQAREEELRAGLAGHWNAPAPLRAWLAKEGGQGTVAGILH